MAHYFSIDRCDSCRLDSKPCKIQINDACGIVGRICGLCHKNGADQAAKLKAERLAVERAWTNEAEGAVDPGGCGQGGA